MLKATMSSDVDAVKSMIYDVFNDDNTFPMNAIPANEQEQSSSISPSHNACPLTDSLKTRDTLMQRTVIEVRNELFFEERKAAVLDQSEEEDDGAPLQRTETVSRRSQSR